MVPFTVWGWLSIGDWASVCDMPGCITPPGIDCKTPPGSSRIMRIPPSPAPTELITVIGEPTRCPLTPDVVSNVRGDPVRPVVIVSGDAVRPVVSVSGDAVRLVVSVSGVPKCCLRAVEAVSSWEVGVGDERGCEIRVLGTDCNVTVLGSEVG